MVPIDEVRVEVIQLVECHAVNVDVEGASPSLDAIMPECPTCEKKLDTDKGVKLHHYYSHGESIALEESNCKECSKNFSYYPSEKKGIYCEQCVKDTPWDWQFNDPGGSKSPNWDRITVECSHCKKQKEVKPSIKKVRNNFFCDVKCMSKYRKEHWQGENHPLWKGGEIESYGYGWCSIRKQARKRDSYCCQICGKTKDDIGYGPEVHHIKPVREFKNIEDAHTMDNVISLCPTCHSNAEHGNISREKLNRKV